MKTVLKIAVVIVIVALPLVFWGNIKQVFSPTSTARVQEEEYNTGESEGEENKKDKKDKKDKKGKKDKKDKKQKDEHVSAEVKSS
jgi:hypothetical protein